MSFRYRDFPIYSQIRQFIIDTYSLTDTLPKKEFYGLSSQLRRAATSALLNIAEGSMKLSDAEFNRFIMISIGSVSETASILDICLDLKYITSSTHARCMLKCETLVKQLYGFSRKLKSTKS